MYIFPKRRFTVAKKLTIWISNHYEPNLFGIRGHYESSYKSGQYVECDSPGTGFFVRNGSSHSYKNFCASEKSKHKQSYWNLVLGREFNFDKELRRAEDALRLCKDDAKARVLESYVNVLPLAKEAELHERVITGIKDLSHRRHKLTSYQSRVLSNTKSRIARLSHDVRNIQMNVPNICGEEQYKAFGKVVVAFSEMACSHRIWHSKDAYDTSDGSFAQVFFDLGIFNYIQAPLMTPLMRDSKGQMIFWYPNYVIVARDAVDFDVVDIRTLNLLRRDVPYDMIANQVLDSYANDDESASVSSHHRRNYDQFGNGLLVDKDSVEADDQEEKRHRERVVGELYIPELKERFYIRDSDSLKEFVHAFNEYKSSLK